MVTNLPCPLQETNCPLLCHKHHTCIANNREKLIHQTSHSLMTIRDSYFSQGWVRTQIKSIHVTLKHAKRSKTRIWSSTKYIFVVLWYLSQKNVKDRFPVPQKSCWGRSPKDLCIRVSRKRSHPLLRSCHVSSGVRPEWGPVLPHKLQDRNIRAWKKPARTALWKCPSANCSEGNKMTVFQTDLHRSFPPPTVLSLFIVLPWKATFKETKWPIAWKLLSYFFLILHPQIHSHLALLKIL